MLRDAVLLVDSQDLVVLSRQTLWQKLVFNLLNDQQWLM